MASAVILDAQKEEADVTGAWGDPPAHRKACWGKGEQNICVNLVGPHLQPSEHITVITSAESGMNGRGAAAD